MSRDIESITALLEEAERQTDPHTEADIEPTSVGPTWPEPLGPAAYYGLVGDIVEALEPRTEADPAALLAHLVVGVSNIWGRGPHFRVGGASHSTNLNAILVGATASGRKGTAKEDTFVILRAVDSDWADNRVMSGLSSGEGLIWGVRDEIEKTEPIRGKDKTITDYQAVIVDKGVQDKRLLILEPEFASVIRVAGREGNTLSAVYRQAWDSGHLRVLNKNSPVKATGAHVSILGHITRNELLAELGETDKANGFANRNLWLCVRRSKFLPDGGDWTSIDVDGLSRDLREAVEFARGAGELRRDEQARRMWAEVYPALVGERLGLFGAITSRAEAQTLRLSCVYALLDKSTSVCEPHLEAALEVWRYAEDSARFIFGDAVGNRTADDILRALRVQPAGLTRREISDLFDRHRSAGEIGVALRLLADNGFAGCKREETGGRPSERWFSLSGGAK